MLDKIVRLFYPQPVRKAAPVDSDRHQYYLALHAAIDHQSLWAATRDLLREHFETHRVTLFLGHIGMREARVVFTDPPVRQADDWFEARARINPFSPWIEAHRGRDLYHFEEIVGPLKDFQQTDFFREFAQVEGWDKGISGLFWENEEVLAMFSLYRSPDQSPFSAEEEVLLREIMPHLRVAIERVTRINQEQGFRLALENFSRSIPVPILLLDWSGQLVFANQPGFESGVVWSQGKRAARQLKAREAFAVPTEIQRAVDHLREEINEIPPNQLGRRMPGARVLQHHRQSHLQARLSPTHYGQSALARPGFIVVFFDLNEFASTSETWSEDQRVRALQQLTPAERVLVQYIGKGYRNAEIAAELNKSILTVKTQLHSIFKKLGVSNRTRLVALARGATESPSRPQ